MSTQALGRRSRRELLHDFTRVVLPFIVSATIGLSVAAVKADVLLNNTLDGTAIANQVFDPSATNITINSVTVFGDAGQIATFTNALSVPDFLTFEHGVVMGSGNVVDLAGPNSADNTSTDIPLITGADGDSDFDSLTSAGTFDAAYVEVNFTPAGSFMTGTFSFASDEYNEYAPPAGANSAGNQYFDVMAFFVNGTNYSVTAAGDNVSINSINETLNAADFVTNDRTDGVPTPVNIQPDGFTRTLTWTAPVDKDVPNTLKFGIADGGDGAFDSWLFIKQYSFKILPDPAMSDLSLTITDNNTAVAAGQSMTYEFAVLNNGPDITGREMTVVSELPAGITINSGQASAVSESGVNGSEWTCVSDNAVPQNISCNSVVPLGITNGNDTSYFSFTTDAVDAGLVGGPALVNTATVSTTDTDNVAANNTVTDSTLVTATDVTGPILSITGAPPAVSNSDPYTSPVLFQFNEDVTGFALGDIAVANGVASAFTAIDGSTYSAVITPTGAGDISINVGAGAAQDAASNASQVAPTVITLYNASAVTVNIQNVPSFVGNSSPYDVTFEFNEDVLGFTLSDISVGNGSASNLVAVDGNTYIATITPDGTSDIIVELPQNSVTDLAGLDSNLLTTATTIYNESVPSVEIQNAPVGVNTTGGYTVTFEFSEDVTGFDVSDIALTNAAAGAFTAVDADTYTLVVNPDGVGDISIGVPESSAIDIASNGNSVAVPAITLYDVISPDVDIQGEPAIVNSLAAYTVTFQFTELVFSFDASDVVLVNATLSNFTMLARDTYTAVISPTGAGDIAIDVPAATSVDVVGNDNTAATQALTVYDDTPPVLTINQVAGDDVINASEDDATVVISGTASGLEDGQEVTVSLNGNSYTTNASGGVWSVSVPAGDAQALPLNSTITADASDLAANPATTATRSLQHDLIPPTLPSVNTLETNDLTPTLSGGISLAAGDVLTVAVNGITYTAGDGDLIDNGDGTWDLAVPVGDALIEGVYEVTATVTDSAGNSVTESTSNELTIDTSAPATPLIAADLIAVDDTGVSSSDNITFDQTAAFSVPAGTGTANDSVTVFADGVIIGTGSVQLDGSFSIATSGMSEGVNAITYQFTDAVGNVSGSSPGLTLTLDTTLAAPVITTPIEVDNRISAAEQLDVLVAGTAEAGSSVQVSFGDGSNPAVVVSVTADGSGNWTLAGNEADLSSLNDTTLTVSAEAIDIAGNTAGSIVVNVVLDSIAPTAPVVNLLITSNTTPSITGNASIAAGDELMVVVNAVTYLAGAGDLSDNGDGTWTLLLPGADALSDGTYDVTATVTDDAGNSSDDVSSAELVVDTIAPAVPTVTAQISNVPAAVIAGGAVLASGESLSVTVNGVTYSVGDGNLADNGDDTWTLTIPAGDALAEGTYSVTATITDAATNSSSDITSNELVIDTTDPLEPTVTALVTNSGTPIVLGTATVGAGETLTVAVNGITYTAGDGNLVDNGDGTWQLTVPVGDSLIEGVFDVTATVTDSAGNSSSEVTSGELTIDVTNPAAGAVAPDLVASDDSGVADDDDITINSIATFDVPAGTGVSGDTVTVLADGNPIGTGTVAGDGSFSVSTSGMLEGANNISYTFTDPAGNTSAASPVLIVTVDSVITAPVIDTPIETDNIVNAAEEGDVLISGTAEADSLVLVSISDGSNPAVEITVTTDGSGNWSLTGVEADISGLDEGSITVDAQSTDAAGNTAAAITGSIDHDSIDPGIPTVTAQTTNDTTPVIIGTASITAGDALTVGINGVTYSAGDGNLVNNGDATWSLTIPAGDTLNEGVYEVVATVTDAAGNPSVDGSSTELEVDNTAPAVPTVSSLVSGSTTPTLSGTATLAVGEILSLEVNAVTYTAGDGNLVDNGNGTWSLTIPLGDALAEDTYSVTATITDAATNSSSDITSNELVIDTTDPLEPTVTALVTNSGTPIVLGTATVGAGETLTVAVNGITYTAGDGNLVDNGDGTWQLTVPVGDSLIEGVFDVTATVTDSAGNSSSEVTSGELTIDVTNLLQVQ